MSAIMPYRHPIEVEVADVYALRDAGPGALLIWDEPSGVVRVHHHGDGVPPQEAMIIVPHEGLAGLAENHEESGRTPTDEDLAEDLSNIAGDWLVEWPEIRALTPLVTPLRQRLARIGITVANAPVYRHPSNGLPEITETYQRPESRLLAKVTCAFAFRAPTRVRVTDPVMPRPVLDLELHIAGRATPADSIAALITANLRTALD